MGNGFPIDRRVTEVWTDGTAALTLSPSSELINVNVSCFGFGLLMLKTGLDFFASFVRPPSLEYDAHISSAFRDSAFHFSMTRRTWDLW